MKINSIIIAAFLMIASVAAGQKYVTKNGTIKFFSDAPLEKIEAVNSQVNSALDSETGDFVFKVLMKSFNFEKALLQEHFNENYVESDKYPNATFVGKITNLSHEELQTDGTFDAIIEGKLTIHGVTKEVSEKGTLTYNDGSIFGKSVFSILLADYKIKIPGAVAKNISETVEITVEVDLDLLNK